VARGTRVQPGWNGSQTTTDRGAPNNSSAVTAKYTPFVNPSGSLRGFSALAAYPKVFLSSTVRSVLIQSSVPAGQGALLKHARGFSTCHLRETL
jgi:hypothetical protein